MSKTACIYNIAVKTVNCKNVSKLHVCIFINTDKYSPDIGIAWSKTIKISFKSGSKYIVKI